MGGGMNAHVPALQRRLLDLIAEYDQKQAGVDDACRKFRAACDTVSMAGCISGTYVSPIIQGRYSVSEDAMRRNLLCSAWKAAYEHIQVGRIAPAADRHRFERELKDPPPFTLDNLRATFGDYVMRPRFHILRGLAECFINLDPAYKSHSRVKIGVKGLPKRVILNSVGSYGSYGRDRLIDVLNSIAAFLGEPLVEHQELSDLDKLHGIWGHVAGEVTIRGQTIRKFQNGNAHVLFDGSALLDINRALAEFYGDVLPDAEDDEPVARRTSTDVSKDLQYYPTPVSVVQRVLDEVGITGPQRYLEDRHRPLRVLEPSCGCGRFLDELKARQHRAVGIEADPRRAAEAKAKGHGVIIANFLEHIPHPQMPFDWVVMNPPFYGRHYVKHVRHALKFLNTDGRLVAILPATAHYDHDVTKEFGGRWFDLPVASFAESGTNVPTGFLVTSAKP
jgi:SAM-dependent methyltransferase